MKKRHWVFRGKRIFLRNKKTFRQGMIFFFISFLLGGTELFGGVGGFAPAFLCAVCACSLPVAPVAVGGLWGYLSAWSGTGDIFTCFLPYLALTAIAVYYQRKGLTPGKYRLQLFLLLTHIPSAVLANMLTYYRILYIIGLAAGAFSIDVYTTAIRSTVGAERDGLPAGMNAVCLAYLAGTALARLGNVTVAGVSLGVVLSVGLCLMSALLSGAVSGCFAGMLLGLVMSAQLDKVPFLCCTLALASASAGALAKNKKYLTAVVFALTYALLTLLFEGYITPTLVLAELGFGTVLFLVVPKEKYMALRTFFVSRKSHADSDSLQRSRDRLQRRLREMSDVFCQMGNLLAGESVPRETDVNVCTHALSRKVCADCVRRAKCDLLPRLRTIAKSVASGIRPEGQALDGCIRPAEMKQAVDSLRDEVNRENLTGKLRDGERNLVSGELHAISVIMGQMADNMLGAELADGETARELKAELESLGLGYLEVTAGRTDARPCCCITRHASRDEAYCEQVIGQAVSTVFGRKMELSACRSHADESGIRTMFYGGAPLFSVTGSASCRTKTDSPVSGDTYRIVTLDETRTLLILSDGMGSGKRANAESTVAVHLIEDLFSVGFPRELVIDTVNRLLLLRSSDESYATLDLCVIDRVKGEAEFIKTGASGGYIKRGNRLISVQPAALPLGVVDNVEPYTARLKLEDGDMIVLMSDGVTESTEADIGAWLSTHRSVSPRAVADGIVNYCMKKTDGVCRDDMTVLAAHVEITNWEKCERVL